MKKQVNNRPANNRPDRIGNKKRKPRRFSASAMKESTTDKGNGPFMHSSKERVSSGNRFGKMLSNSYFDIHDKRVTRLLSLLHQLDESAGGLASLPSPELDEVLYSAVRFSGFSNPTEARNVTAHVLDGLKMKVS